MSITSSSAVSSMEKRNLFKAVSLFGVFHGFEHRYFHSTKKEGEPKSERFIIQSVKKVLKLII